MSDKKCITNDEKTEIVREIAVLKTDLKWIKQKLKETDWIRMASVGANGGTIIYLVGKQLGMI